MECRNGSEADILKWITSLIPPALLSLDPGTQICETKPEFDTGAICASVYLGLVAFFVVIGEGMIF